MIMIIGCIISYIIIAMFVINILDIYTQTDHDMCHLLGGIWPLILPGMIIRKTNKVIRGIVKKEKFKKLLIFKDMYSTITVNTKVSGREQ